MKIKSIIRTGSLFVAFLLPALAFAAGGGLEFAGNKIINLINNILVPILFAVAFIVFIYGVAKTYIFSHGEAEAVADGHRLILWGLIGFVIMISVWGLVNMVSDTFGLSGPEEATEFNSQLPKTPMNNINAVQ